jgi:hypothetical protein
MVTPSTVHRTPQHTGRSVGECSTAEQHSGRGCERYLERCHEVSNSDEREQTRGELLGVIEGMRLCGTTPHAENADES